MSRKALIDAKVLEELLQSLEKWRMGKKLTSGEFEFLLNAELRVVKAINKRIITIEMNEVEEKMTEPDVEKFVS